MDIRTIADDGLDELLQLYTHLHDADDPLPSPGVIAQTWEELRGNPRYQYFGGFLGDQLVATCALTVVPNLTRGCRPYGLIENVVTHSQHRGRGYGKAVLAHALAHAWSVNCYKVMLMTGRKDEAVHNFYQSAGFDRNGKQAFVARPP